MQIQGLGATDYMIPELDPNFLNGLGISEEELRGIGEVLAGNEALTIGDMADAMRPFSDDERKSIIGEFLSFGGDPRIVNAALVRIERVGTFEAQAAARRGKGLRISWGILGTVSMAAGAYHGYRRNQSLGWALVWGAMGGLFPIITPAVALAQGFGERK